MRKLFFRFSLLLAIVGITSVSKAQLVNGISVNTSGNSNETGAILDLSDNITAENYGFLPPYVSLTNATVLNPPITGGTAANLSGLIVYNTNVSLANGLSGPGLYFWDNPLSSWKTVGGVSSANNGISVSGTVFQLGGNNLIHATNIPLNGFALSITGSANTTTFATSGKVGIGNAAPNAKAIVDLTNATNLGLMLPRMTTAQMPAVTAAQNGLVIYNTTIKCPEIVTGGSWGIWGINHGSQTFTGASIQYWTVPPCITTITIVASGSAGGSGSGTGGNGAVVTVFDTVTPGEVLGIAVGQFTPWIWMGGSGGGGTFVWSTNSTTLPRIAAGGGGGGGGTSGGNGLDASSTTVPTSNAHTGAGGAGGNAGVAGTGACGGGAGAGWLTTAAGAQPAANTLQLGAGGVGYPGNFLGGLGAYEGGRIGNDGGFGGGGGGGSATNGSNYGGGGGGGGYNGGGGGNGADAATGEYSGGGGGSCYFGANVVGPNTIVISNTGTGSVTITW